MSTRSLFDLVEAGAAGVPEHKLAVASDQDGLGFRALLAGARGIATTLRDYGVGRGHRVGVWMDKTPSSVQVILGILASGAAYVPLDPRAPWRRCRAIAADCGLAALAADGMRAASLPSLLEGQSLKLMLFDSGDTGGLADNLGTPCELLQGAAARAPGTLPGADPDDIAYILYTSGSTGTPKGVVHTHRSALAFTQWIQQRFRIEPGDVFSSHAPFHFDLSISDLYASLGSGASVRLISSTEGMLAPYLVRGIPEWRITVWYSVPSILVSMLDRGGLEERGLPGLRLLFFAGEVFPAPQLRRLRKALPAAGLFNLFGPTETNVCTYYEVPDDLSTLPDAPIPIGRACEHMETFVMDDDGREAEPGMEGTLWAKGGNLMLGYWNDADRTAATLRADPRGRPGPAFCTGDRVRQRPDGDYDFLGRLDHMIKVRGYRVELGEVETALTSHPSVLEAVAVPLSDSQGGHRLVASVVHRTGAAVPAMELKAFCRERLPVYMVPETIEVRAELPRTSTGKADRTILRSEWELRAREAT